ncbi:MAG TPA: hypothetical protein VJ207_07475 [Thermoplasmata archaeon]|nr:hypothetical protein [Thermoplasmata archaeon]
MGPWLRRMRVWRAWGAWHEDLLRLSVLVLVVVAFLEAFIGRAVTRAFPLMPPGPASTFLFETFGRVSVFLFNLGVILVVLILVLVLWALRVGTRRLPLFQDRIATFAIAFLVLSLGSFLIRDPVMLVALTILFLAVAVGALIATAAPSPSPWPRAFSALALTVYGASRYFVLASAIGQLGQSTAAPVGGLEALYLAEAAASLAPIPLFASVYLKPPRNPRVRIPVLIPSIVAGLFVFVVFANPAITAAIAKASFGFTLFLPFPIYALGLWLATSSFLLLRRTRALAKAYGIALVMIAGIDLVLTYQALLATAGLLLWAIEEERAGPTPATMARAAPVPARARVADSEPAARGSR